MYSFIAWYENMETEEVTSFKIDIDLTPIDEEMMEWCPEELFAWKCASEKAYNIFTEMGLEYRFFRLDLLFA